MLRFIRVICYVAAPMIVAACLGGTDTVKLRFDNRTDFILCSYPSAEDAGTRTCDAPIKPMDETGYGYGCGYGNGFEENPVTVIVTKGERGPEVYGKTTTCRIWNQSDRTLVFEERVGEIAVSGGPP